MPKVVVLSDHVASQIAAGEVVERPAAVVKELIENSIDSGATQIEIAVGADCRDIRVADNGCGMEAEDALLAFQSHATSKINVIEDLNSLHTLGFRGEALPSIAAVSRVTCYTRTKEASQGTRIEAADGKISTHQAGCAPGTAIEVTDLFYNVPARLKFLKKASTEFAHIHEIVQSLAIAYPKIVFQLLNEGEVILRTSGSGKLAAVMQETSMLSGKEELLAVTGADLRYGLAVYGYIVRPPHCRGDRKGVFSIVNNRPVRCQLTYKALDQAFAEFIPRGRYALGVLTVTIDPAQVDVNIHPTKKEIKYESSSDVYRCIYNALQEALRSCAAPVPAGVGMEASDGLATTEFMLAGSTGRDTSMINDSSAVHSQQCGTVRESLSAGMPLYSAAALHATAPLPGLTDLSQAAYQRAQQVNFRDRLAYQPASSVGDPSIKASVHTQATLPAGWRIVGYLHNTYILLQTPEGLEIVEQHIAHERVIYERVRAQQEIPGRISQNSQRLVISAPLELTPAQRSCLEENLPVLQTLGFDFDIQNGQVACTQVPLELASKDYAASVQENVEQLLSAGAANFALEATKSLACQSAIKNGMPLSESEIVELLSAWHDCPAKQTCPHGRPVSIRFSKDDLYQLFHPV